MIQKCEINTMPSIIPQKIEAEPIGSCVVSFNGRTGAVRPLSGDYTAAMVGADPKGSAATVAAKIPTKISQLSNDSNYATQTFVEDKIADIKGGKDGVTFIPSVSQNGELSWQNDGDLENPDPVNIKGPKGDNGSTPYIGENENWFIDGVDTGHLAVGSNGAIFIPTVSENGDISWDNNGELPNPVTVNIRGPEGEKGSPGATFIPSVSEGGILEWENDGGFKNPAPVDIKGPQGPQGIQGEQGVQGETGPAGPPATINGKEAINIVSGKNITLEEDGENLKISATVPTAGQDMIETNGELNPKIPIRYLTLDEYNALTDEEKMADIQYIVDDGESEVGEYKAEMVHFYSNGSFSVRECEDGYCEVTYFGSIQMNEAGFTTIGSSYWFSLDTATVEMPFEFAQKYSETLAFEAHSSNNEPFPGILQIVCRDNHLTNDLYLGDWSLIGMDMTETAPTYNDYTIDYVVRVTGMKAGA